MTLRNLFILNAVIALFFGSTLVLVTTLILSVYGVTLSPAGIYIARILGAALLGYAVVTWFTRNAEDSKARRAIVLGQFAHSTLGFILSLLAQLAGLMNPLGWSIAGLYLLLALGYAYFLLLGPSTS